MDHIIHSSSFPSSSLSNPNLARLAIPYSTSLPSLRNQANDHHMSGAQPTSPTRGPTPVDLQNHLYQSFLSRKTADVALRIRGSWNALYKLHRVILIQAGFFQSLFTAGFSESKAKVSVRRSEPDVIDIVFDDPNITRAAFEICIARLYGGGPPLHVSPSLVPTPSQPLTPAFPAPASSSTSTSIPAGQHPATPRFLLSLLATAVFLSLPALAAEALQMILTTVGPYTAVRYLQFAIGKGIGPVEEGEVGDGRMPAVGLESVAELVEEDAEEREEERKAERKERREEERKAERKERRKEKAKENELAEQMRGLDVVEAPTSDTEPKRETSIRKEAPASAASSDSDFSDMDLGSDDEVEQGTDADTTMQKSTPSLEPTYYYGAVSNKVGEAAACWLARWGVDILRYEEGAMDGTDAGMGVQQHVRWEPAPRGQGHVRSRSEDQGGTRKRTSTAPSRFAEPSRNGAGWQKEKEKAGDLFIPVVWRRGGLSARWVRGLLSSDALFVRGEKERYDMAKTVVEMRRRAGVDEDEEKEWEELFRTGIYYENMVLDELMAISRDVSPLTGDHYVPLSVLQCAHWNQDVLRHRITAKPASSSQGPPLSPSQRDKELGISVSTVDVAAVQDSSSSFYPVPADSSMRIGDSMGIEGGSVDQLLDVMSPNSFDTNKKAAVSTSDENFFGLRQQRFPASSVAASASGVAAKWSPHPPFRFSVEFWDVETLKEKSRLHSHTVWYAGSLYNVYVQVVRKKGVQLGVYLHRQSSVDPLPASSAPLCALSRLQGQTQSQPQNRPASGSVSSPRPSSLHSSPNGYSSSGLPMLPLSRSTTPTSMPNSPALASSLPSGLSSSSSSSTLASSNTLPATAPAVSPQQPYRDPRPAVSAYFAIACASATGASLTRFTSAPDVFSVSQSWGWKSSSLRTEEYIEVGPDGQPRSGQGVVPAGREVSLRATVVLGVV